MDSPFAFCRGDVIELKTQAAAGQVPDWYYGKCERTGLEGPFPFDSVYILPAIDRPPNEFLVKVLFLYSCMYFRDFVF